MALLLARAFGIEVNDGPDDVDAVQLAQRFAVQSRAIAESGVRFFHSSGWADLGVGVPSPKGSRDGDQQ